MQLQQQFLDKNLQHFNILQFGHKNRVRYSGRMVSKQGLIYKSSVVLVGLPCRLGG